MSAEKKVIVLMSTYNGEKFLEKQIESILNQKDVLLKLIVRDDGSTDRTPKILESYEQRGVLEWYTGENKRTARSFIDLINFAPTAEYYAFSDQDDIWMPDKLKTAIKKLERYKNMPALYAGNYHLVDSNLNELINTNVHQTTTTFRESIVYSCCTGCTMLINKQLIKRIKGKVPQNIFMHDDWIHKVCLAVGGKVLYDDSKKMLYRQHGNNVEGGKHSLMDKINKVLKDKKKNNHIMRKQLAEIISIFKDEMPLENYLLAKKAIKKSQGNIFQRCSLFLIDNYIIKSNKKLNTEFRISLLLNYW